jgi:hypothetical protein
VGQQRAHRSDAKVEERGGGVLLTAFILLSVSTRCKIRISSIDSN